MSQAFFHFSGRTWAAELGITMLSGRFGQNTVNVLLRFVG